MRITRPQTPLEIVVSRLALVLLLTLGQGTESLAQGGKPKPDVPVTSTLNDTGIVTSDTNHRIQSDGSGSYYNGVASVQSIIQGSSGDWVLDTGPSATRSILVDFRDPVMGSTTAPFAWQMLPARIIVKCHLVNSSSFPGIALNSSLNCPFHVAFTYPGSGGSTYAIAQNPLNYGETNFATVTCVAANSAGACNHWTIRPSATQPSGQLKNIGKLLKELTGNKTPQDLGVFYMSFFVDVTNP
jgi:hypothetical protein